MDPFEREKWYAKALAFLLATREIIRTYGSDLVLGRDLGEITVDAWNKLKEIERQQAKKFEDLDPQAWSIWAPDMINGFEVPPNILKSDKYSSEKLSGVEFNPNSYWPKPPSANISSQANASSRSSFSLTGLTQIQGQLNALLTMFQKKQDFELNEMSTSVHNYFSESIARETMYPEQYHQIVYENNLKAMDNKINFLWANNRDVSGLTAEKERYMEFMKPRLEWEQKLAEDDREIERNHLLLALEIDKNNKLVSLNAKTQAEIDALDRQSLEKKKGHLLEILQDQRLTDAERLKHAKEYYENERQLHELNRRNIETASQEAINDLKNRTIDYAKIMNQPYFDLENSIINNFTNILTGAESFSEGFKNIFRDLSQSVIRMMVQMWYYKVLLEPMKKWWGGVLNDLFPTQKAAGGAVASGETYIVGELGPELFIPSTPGTIIPNNRIADFMSPVSAPSVTVNIVNNTGVQAQPRQEEARWDGQQYIVNVVLDAYARNVNGMRDILNPRRY